MQSQQTHTERAGACYVFFRIFPGLREPCELARYVTLSDAEINTAMEADAARWLDENRAQVMEKLQKQSQQRMGIGSYGNEPRSAPAERSFTFPVIARIAGWTYRECFSIGVGDGRWASARFPILVAANWRDAADICDGLNHRHRQHPHPDSPRFGWLPASAFPHDEQLDIGAKIIEAQAGRIHGEAAAVIYSLAAEALVFHESLQRSLSAAANDAKPANAVAQPPDARAAESDGESVPDSRAGFLGGTELADVLGVHPTRRAAFIKQLERQRTKLGDDCWSEVREPQPNCPRYLYRSDSPKVRELAARYKHPKPA
jgi:hypothetical protein